MYKYYLFYFPHEFLCLFILRCHDIRNTQICENDCRNIQDTIIFKWKSIVRGMIVSVCYYIVSFEIGCPLSYFIIGCNVTCQSSCEQSVHKTQWPLWIYFLAGMNKILVCRLKFYVRYQPNAQLINFTRDIMKLSMLP